MYNVISKDNAEYINSLNGLQKAKVIKEVFMSEDKLEIPDNIYGVVYKISNLINNKVYIGSSINYDRRVSNYVASALGPEREYDRPVEKFLREEGILNFRIEKIGFAHSDAELRNLEFKEIRNANSLNPEIGYNTSASFMLYKRRFRKNVKKKMSESHKGLTQTADTKRKKSKMCISINIETKILYICDSMKLFGEVVINKSKDIIKNTAKSQQKISGFYIFYFDLNDITAQINAFNKRYEDYSHRGGYKRGRENEYNLLSTMVYNRDWEKLSELFTIKTLRYIDEEPLYEIKEIQKDNEGIFIITQ